MLEQNKICPFCYSNLSLSAELPLTKKNTGFFIKNNSIEFDVNKQYFNHAKIDINSQIFNIEKSNQSNINGLYTNYKSASFQRTCHFCINNFYIKYARFKCSENKIESVKIESINFKFFIKSDKNIIYYISNNYVLDETIIKKNVFENDNILYEVKEDLKLPLVDFNFNSEEQIYDTIYSIFIFY